ncbi:hypothetical protein Gpo141_00007898 [Globisporangium polare]
MRKYQKEIHFGEDLHKAVQTDQLELAQWLCDAHCPTGFVWNPILGAANLRNIAILDWLTTRYPYIRTSSKLMDSAASGGQLETMQWIHRYLPGTGCSPVAMRYAIQVSDFPMVQWLQAHYPEQTEERSLEYAVRYGDVRIAQFFLDAGFKFKRYGSYNYASWSGNLEMVKWVHSKLSEPSGEGLAVSSAALNGHLNIVKWIDENLEPCYAEFAMYGAATNGHLEVIQWLHANRHELITADVMDAAAINGHTEIVQWFHANRSEGCSSLAIDGAAGNGHLQLVKWLYVNRREGWSEGAIEQAAANGHLDVLTWLHENGSLGFCASTMDIAAAANHLGIVKWLHGSRTEGCTTDAMDEAAKNDHLEVVKWLHENRSEGCTTKAMDGGSSLEMVQWLHVNRSEGCTSSAMDNAAKNGDFWVMHYLHTHRSEGCTSAAAEYAVQSKRTVTLKWLCETYPDKIDIDSIRKNAVRDGEGDFANALLEHVGLSV